MITMANELIAMSRFFADGIPVNDDTLALDVIEKVTRHGPGFTFKTEDHTIQHFKQAQFFPKLLDRTGYDFWEQAGAQDMYTRCNLEAKRILLEHQVIPKPDNVLQEIQHILQK
jgi:trimethylamine--corrinoid protein Co-methyltransferase